jgi:hypothetical protein
MPYASLPLNSNPNIFVLYRGFEGPILLEKVVLPMVWVVEKKVFYHILDMGFESVGIPVRVKFEFDVQDGNFVPDSLSIKSLYNQQAVVNRYPGNIGDVVD